MDQRPERSKLRQIGAALCAALVAAPLAAGAAGMDATSAVAAPVPAVTVTPATGASATGQTFAVSGSNVSTTANGGIGIYVAFGPDPATLPGDWSSNPSYFQNVAWTHPAPPPSGNTPTNRPLQSDGTFSFPMTKSDGSPLTAQYTTSAGSYDCTQIECGIITFTAHGVPDRSQDTFTPVSFAPVISPTTLPSTNRTQAYSQTLTATGGTAPYTWALDSGTLPAGLTLNPSTGVIAGSTSAAAAAGTSSFTVSVTDSTAPTAKVSTQALSILVKTPTVTVTPATNANPSGQTFTVTGSGFNPNAPVPGSPTGTGSYVAFGPNPSLLPASPAFYQSTSYYEVAVWARLNPAVVTDGQKAMNADGTFSFTFTSGGTASTEGTPRALTALYTTSAGTYDCTQIQCGIVTFRSQGNGDRSQDTFTPVTFASAVSIPTASLSSTNRTQAYSQTLTVDGGTAPYTWSIDSGTLPAGLTLNPSTGVISGSTTAAAPAGTSSFTVRVTDSSANPQSTTKALSILVKTPTVTVTPATNGNPSGQTFTVTGSGFNPNAPVPGSPTGTGSYVAFGPNPALLPASPAFYQSTSYYEVAVWARLNPAVVSDGQKAMNADGTFSFTFTSGGTASTEGGPRALTALYTTSAGTYDCTQIQCGIVTFRSQGNGDRSQDTFTPVTFASAVSVSTTTLAGGTVGQAYSKPLTVAGGTAPYTWSIAAGSLPAGLSLNAATGVISGVPNTAATSSFTVRVTDSSASPQTGTRPLSIAVASTPNPASAKVGVPYSTPVPRAGTAPFSFVLKSGALPPGLTLNASTGVLRGTPTTSGVYKATIQVTDSAAKPKKTNTKLEITVAPAAITISPATLANGVLGTAYSRTLTAVGGTANYKFAVTSGALPLKLKLSAKGVLSGTPKQAGTYSFVVTATDKNGFTGTRSYTLRIV